MKWSVLLVVLVPADVLTVTSTVPARVCGILDRDFGATHDFEFCRGGAPELRFGRAFEMLTLDRDRGAARFRTFTGGDTRHNRQRGWWWGWGLVGEVVGVAGRAGPGWTS